MPYVSPIIDKRQRSGGWTRTVVVRPPTERGEHRPTCRDDSGGRTPLPVDRYLALSALQKAIRRGEEDLALRAAMTVRIEGPQAIWRRLGIIAFEDVGVANIDVVG